MDSETEKREKKKINENIILHEASEDWSVDC